MHVVCQAASRNKYGNSVLFTVCSRWEESAPWGWLSWAFTGIGTRDFLCFKVISYSGYSLSWNQMKPLSPQCFLSGPSFVPMFVFWSNHDYKAAVVSKGAYDLDSPALLRFVTPWLVLSSLGWFPFSLQSFSFTPASCKLPSLHCCHRPWLWKPLKSPSCLRSLRLHLKRSMLRMDSHCDTNVHISRVARRESISHLLQALLSSSVL